MVRLVSCAGGRKIVSKGFRQGRDVSLMTFMGARVDRFGIILLRVDQHRMRRCRVFFVFSRWWGRTQVHDATAVAKKGKYVCRGTKPNAV